SRMEATLYHLGFPGLPVEKLQHPCDEERKRDAESGYEQRHRIVEHPDNKFGRAIAPRAVGGVGHGQTAQQAQPSAPQKPLRSAMGRWGDQAVAWSWP